ncbi:MAG: hypothetical protein ACYT04_57065, partial [Nostoc sp.]
LIRELSENPFIQTYKIKFLTNKNLADFSRRIEKPTKDLTPSPLSDTGRGKIQSLFPTRREMKKRGFPDTVSIFQAGSQLLG